MTKRTALSILLTAALLVAGCGSSHTVTEVTQSQTTVNPSELPDQQGAPERLIVRVSIKDGAVTPTNEQLQAAVGQPIRFRVDSDAADELHVHSTPEHSFKIEPKVGQVFQFTVSVPGKVDVELHDLNKTIATIAVR
ncbi:hypothetical protein AB4Z42_14230 [Mycobacterium sp. 2YAF39]|uniref:hypothetical protein n=1 Tax=Mycobacterium sp. 2YAF39 TaxID=3233033 RepID=UPI003F978F7B